jgi:transposase-like protein
MKPKPSLMQHLYLVSQVLTGNNVYYALSYRNIEEMMKELGFEIGHATLNRWVLHYAPLLEKKAKNDPVLRKTEPNAVPDNLKYF